MHKICNGRYSDIISNSYIDNCITIFTPTYNRSELIYRVFHCLVNQINNNFVWIVVNDGSTDNTDNVLIDILNQNIIPIMYISKSNGGKHSAFQVALNECKTEYFMCMDDDDIYSSSAVDTYLDEWKRIKKEGKQDEIGAIRTLTREEDGTIVCNFDFNVSLFGERIDKTTLESNYIHHEFFENWTCYSTSALRSVDIFPKQYWMSTQHKFFAEAIWQGRFARKYKCRYYHVILREYRHDTETSLIRSIKSRQHYIDMFINFHMILNEHWDFFCFSPLYFIKCIFVVSILRHKLSISLRDFLANTRYKKLKLCYLVLCPFALLVSYPKFK